jgi:phosphonate transport system substrate-binding protein
MKKAWYERSLCIRRASQLALVVALLSSLLAGLSANSSAQATPVEEPGTITIAWLPNNSADNEQAFRDAIAKAISQATGKKVENKLTTDYAIAIAALENGDAQLGWFGPYEYLVSHAKNPKVIPLAVESGVSGTLKDAEYHSRFLVKKGNEGQYASGNGYSIDNIAGKRMSFVSASSTSGFNVPAGMILGTFTGQDKWKNLTKEDLAQGGDGKFFSQVLFAGSHQLSLLNVLKGMSDMSAVDDIDVEQYVTLASGKGNEEGAVYTLNQDVGPPFNNQAGAQFVVIKSAPVLNTPFEANSAYLNKETLDAITRALTSDEVTNNPNIFAPQGTKGSVLNKPCRFMPVDDAWYDPMRKVLGIK